MVRDMAQRFAREAMREAAAASDAACKAPDGFAAQFAELGLAQFAVPEALGGAATESSVVTQVLVAEDLAYGDMGLALAALAPIGVANALARFGSAEQQATYLPAVRGRQARRPPRSRSPSGGRRSTRTSCARAPKNDGGGFVLRGEKTLVPLAESAELLLVAADLKGKGRSCSWSSRARKGVSVKAEPGMGLRAAGLGSFLFDDVRLPHAALLGGDPTPCATTSCCRAVRSAGARSRSAWRAGGARLRRCRTATTARRSASRSATVRRWRS